MTKAEISHRLRTEVWNRHVGKAVGATACPYCGYTNEITQLNFECGHVVPEARGGATTAENLRPVCGPCNRSIGAHLMRPLPYKIAPRPAACACTVSCSVM